MYIIEGAFVYQVEKTEHFEVKAGIGKQKKIELISETDTEKIYECQTFDLAKEKYVIDDENSETTEIDGKEYKADRGKVMVPKEPPESEAKIKELGETLNQIGKQLAKEKLENMKKDKTISELGKHESKLTLDIMRNKNEINAIKQQLNKGGN